MQINIIKRLFGKASDLDGNIPKVKRKAGEFEQFSVNPNSKTEFVQAKNTLESLPEYGNPDYPPGVYIDSNGTIAAVQ